MVARRVFHACHVAQRPQEGFGQGRFRPRTVSAWASAKEVFGQERWWLIGSGEWFSGYGFRLKKVLAEGFRPKVPANGFRPGRVSADGFQPLGFAKLVLAGECWPMGFG